MPPKTVKEQLGVDLPEPTHIEPQAVQEPEAEVPERPEWLPEKFKDETEFATSYKNLEDELRRRGEDQKGLETQISQLTSLVENIQQPPQQGNANEYQEQLMSAYEADPLGTIVFLSQQAAQQQLQAWQTQNQPQLAQQQVVQGELLATTAERLMEAKHNDWREYQQRVGEVLERNPQLLGDLSSMDKTTEVMEAVYKQVKYDDLVSQIESGNSDTTRMKQQAQTVSGTAGRPGQPSEVDDKMARLLAAAKGTSYSAFRNG